VLRRQGIEHAHLGDARQSPREKASSASAAAGALLGRSGRKVLVGDALVEATGESLGFLTAGRGADRLENPCRQDVAIVRSSASARRLDGSSACDNRRRQKSHRTGGFAGRRRRSAESLRIPSDGLGIRGKARFVLFRCCACEGRGPRTKFKNWNIFIDISMY
jgi:hypothetical protein